MCVKDPLTGEVFSIEGCASCGLGRTDPVPHDFSPYYPSAYYGGRHGMTADFCLGRRLNWIENKRQRGERLLDVGCGDGSLLLAAKVRGWKVTGLERFPDDARVKGLDVFMDVSELKPTSGYDCITLWHSLEHIAEPFKLLEQLRGFIKPGGKVIVAVPDFGGWQARLFGRYWLHLDVPRHLWHFTQPALRGAFEKAGLEVTQTFHQEFEYDLLGWSQSMLNALFKTPNVFFNWLTKKPTHVTKPMLILHVFLGFLFSGFSVPLVWLGSMFKCGGTLIVIGNKHV
jgi:SAM-dependent methyltransferase